MKVLVTGANGQLGRDVVAAAAAVNHEVAALDHSELDITDWRAVKHIVRVEHPQAVVNCGAYTNVDGAEDDRTGAFAVNAEGAANLARATAEIESKLVYPSTDYVFDGNKGSPYTESNEVNPLSVYGQSKLAGELETSNTNPQHFIVRSSWLFGIHGNNFVKTMLYLARDNDQVLVVKDQKGCPTYTGHLAAAIVRLLDTSFFGVHHIAGWGECSWYEFAIEIFRQAEEECRVMAATTDMGEHKAPRPAYSSLRSEREHAIYLPRWQDGLAEFLRVRAEQVSQVEVSA